LLKLVTQLLAKFRETCARFEIPWCYIVKKQIIIFLMKKMFFCKKRWKKWQSIIRNCNVFVPVCAVLITAMRSHSHMQSYQHRYLRSLDTQHCHNNIVLCRVTWQNINHCELWRVWRTIHCHIDLFGIIFLLFWSKYCNLKLIAHTKHIKRYYIFILYI